MTPKILVMLSTGTVALAAGCGDTTTTDKTVATHQVPMLPAAAETAQTPRATNEANHEGAGTAPDETGIRLDVAEKSLRGRKIPYKVLGGANTSWTVCKTNPAPRSHLESGTTLYLIVARSCK